MAFNYSKPHKHRICVFSEIDSCAVFAFYTHDNPCRQYTVFSLAAIANEAASSAHDEDLPDEFYDLTPADLSHEMTALRRRQQYQEAGLRTKARCAQSLNPSRTAPAYPTYPNKRCFALLFSSKTLNDRIRSTDVMVCTRAWRLYSHLWIFRHRMTTLHASKVHQASECLEFIRLHITAIMMHVWIFCVRMHTSAFSIITALSSLYRIMIQQSGKQLQWNDGWVGCSNPNKSLCMYRINIGRGRYAWFGEIVFDGPDLSTAIIISCRHYRGIRLRRTVLRHTHSLAIRFLGHWGLCLNPSWVLSKTYVSKDKRFVENRCVYLT